MTNKDDNMIEICVAVQVNRDGSWWAMGYDVEKGKDKFKEADQCIADCFEEQSPMVKQTYHVKFKVPKPKIIEMDLGGHCVYPTEKITLAGPGMGRPIVITKPLGMDVTVVPKGITKTEATVSMSNYPVPVLPDIKKIAPKVPKDKIKKATLPAAVVEPVRKIVQKALKDDGRKTGPTANGNSGSTPKWTQYRMEIVAYICANGPARQGEIAKALSIPVGSMTSIMVHEFFEQNANGEWMVVKSEVQVTEPSE